MSKQKNFIGFAAIIETKNGTLRATKTFNRLGDVRNWMRRMFEGTGCYNFVSVYDDGTAEPVQREDREI